MDALEQTFMVRQLQPWFANVKKRLIKRPKLYFLDSGIFHTLIGIETQRDLMRHPKLEALQQSKVNLIGNCQVNYLYQPCFNPSTT